MKWDKLPLGILCSLITDGKHGDCANEDGSGYFFISAKDVKNGKINYENARQITHDDFLETHRRTDLNPGDVLITNSGTIGRLAIAKNIDQTPRTTFQKSVAILKPINEKVSSEFLYYSLAYNKNALINTAGGAAQKNLLLGELRRFEIQTPNLPVQASITDILSTYDELIENNRRRIQLLEKSARFLYKEWFVHLRFPGHEHVKIIDGVPEGWEKTIINEVAETLGGGTPSTKITEYWDDGDITWFVPKDLTRNDSLVLLYSEKKITELGLKKSSAKMLPPETIMMSSRASIGFFGIHEYPACTNQGFISLIPKFDVTRMYLLYNLMSRKEEIVGLAGGTTYKEINKSTFRSIPIIIPTSGLLEQFDEFAYDILKQVRIIKKHTQKLEAARDILLPRLMNGEIAV